MQNIIVTGASGEVAREVIPLLCGQGYRVIACHRRPLAEPLRSLCAESVSVSLDNEQNNRKTLAQLYERHNPVTGVVLLAGGFSVGALGESPWQAVEHMIALNFKTAYCTARHAHAEMKKRKTPGHLIFMGASLALSPREGSFAMAYTLAKSLLLPLAEGINATAHTSGLRATLLVPGVINTPSNRRNMPHDDASKWITPQQIGQRIHALLQEDPHTACDTLVRLPPDAPGE